MQNQFTHPWTTEEIDFLKNNIKKLTYKQMSAYVNRSPASIQSKIRYLPFKQKVKKHSVNSHFFKQWSTDMAYILGFIAADGNICHSGRGYVLHIACDDKDVIEKAQKKLEYKGPIYEKPRNNGKISYSLRICDPIIFEDLKKLNITERKSLTITPPLIPEKYIRHFIRGFFDGDGSVSLRNKLQSPSKLIVELYTASPYMADFLYKTIKQLLGDIYKGKIRHALTHQKTPFYHIRLGQKGGEKLFTYMYEDTTLYMERKYNRFIEGINYVS